MANHKIFHKQLNILLLLLLFWIFASINGFSQIKITGKVISQADNEALPGVTVLVKGTTNGVVTDIDGNYSITVNSNKDVLVFSMVGMVPQEIEVGNQSLINVTLETKVTGLDEVVVIGYGTVRKSDLTGSVSSVKSKELTAIPVTNALEALQGKVAGLDLTKSSGQPGASLNLTVRGNRSINAQNKPLIIVDGVDYGSTLDISPNDIESVEVLKDGSSTAIYGSRGANGVVLITTKRGVAGKSKISVNSYYDINTVSMYPKFTDGYQWIALRKEANPSASIHSFAQRHIFVDWRKLLIHQGYQQNHQVNISGGSEKTTYSVSGEYNNEQGILKLDNLNRYSGRVSLDHQVFKWLKVGASAFYAYTDQNKRANPFNEANKIPPVGFVYDTVNTSQINPFPLYDKGALNPLIEEAPGVRTDKKLVKRFFSTSYLEFKINPNITYKSTLGVTIGGTREGIYAGALSFVQNNTVSFASIEDTSYVNVLWENLLTINKTLGIHELNFIVGSSTQENKGERYYLEGKNILNPNKLWYDMNGATDLAVSSGFKKLQMVSFFGRINYKLLNKYLLTTSLRWDGASQLAEGHKGQFFPSVALGWKLKEEELLKNIDFISSLKLRGSYGLTGNQSVEPYATQGVLGQTQYSFGETDAIGYYPMDMANQSLGWETTATRDLGLDFGFFKNRVSGSLTVYYQNTYDLLLYESLPTSSGFFHQIDNVGKTENKGIEVNISSVNIDLGTNNFKWSTDLNFAMNKEKIIDLGTGLDIIFDPNYSNSHIVHKVGEPVNSFYDYDKIGIWQIPDSLEAAMYAFVPGDIKLRDVNGDTAITTSDRVIKGHANPDWTLGFNNSFQYKGFELSCFIYARTGQTIQYEGYYGWKYAGDANTTIQDYWTRTNPTNSFPHPGSSAKTKTYISTLGYADGSFIKIRDITLGYTFPSKWMSKAKISRLRLYTTLKNYFTFSKIKDYDPERGGDLSFPMTKQCVFGINLEF